jgi:hypothetical protein
MTVSAEAMPVSRPVMHANKTATLAIIGDTSA